MLSSCSSISRHPLCILVRLTDGRHEKQAPGGGQNHTKPRGTKWCVWRGLFDGVSILWVAHPIVVHGPGIWRRMRTSEVRVSRRSAVLHRFGPSAFGFGTFCTYTTNRFRPRSMLCCCVVVPLFIALTDHISTASRLPSSFLSMRCVVLRKIFLGASYLVAARTNIGSNQSSVFPLCL